MAELFENFKKWLEQFRLASTVLSNIGAGKYDSERDPARAAKVLEESLKEAGEDEKNAKLTAGVFARESNEEEVKNLVKFSEKLYKQKIEESLTTKFKDLYNTTPNSIKKGIYNILEYAKPKSDLSKVPKDLVKAANLHSYISKFKRDYSRYRSGEISESEKEEIEKRVIGKLFDYYKQRFLDSSEKIANFGEMVEVLKRWINKKPEVAMTLFAPIYEKRKKEFESLIKKDNLYDYLAKVIDEKNLRKLYRTAIYLDEQMEERKREQELGDLIIGS